MEHHFQGLILLIGTNPLPNLVVGDYFLQKNPKINTLWLVHSEERKPLQAGTADLAENLEHILRNRWLDRTSGSLVFNKVALSDVSDAREIRRNAQGNLFERLDPSTGIHLNYTGGTKSMSTHVYWLMKEWYKGNISFSYLDARNFRLVDDDHGVKVDDLRKNVALTTDELIRLHGFKRKNKEKDDIFSDTHKAFEAILQDHALDKLLYQPDRGGYDRGLFLSAKGKLAEKVKDIFEIDRLRDFSPNKMFMSVITSMPEEYRLFDASGNFRSDIRNNPFKAALKYIDGGWLEQYVFKTVENEFGGGALSIAKNIEIHKPEWKSNEKFELDVVVLNGYQPTGISCTTVDNKPGCKSKGFEIIHRIRQIGGDEAKAVLVCFLDEERKDELQTELAYHTGGSKENILILGKSDLQKDVLARSLREFILET